MRAKEERNGNELKNTLKYGGVEINSSDVIILVKVVCWPGSCKTNRMWKSIEHKISVARVFVCVRAYILSYIYYIRSSSPSPPSPQYVPPLPPTQQCPLDPWTNLEQIKNICMLRTRIVAKNHLTYIYVDTFVHM